MSDAPLRPISRILVATGLSVESVGAVLVARSLAQRYGAKLHAVHVVEPQSADAERALPGVADAYRRIAEEEFQVFARSHGLSDVAELHLRVGPPELEVLHLVRQTGADLLVLGRYGKGGLKRGMLGSIADMLARKCPVSVLVVDPVFRGDFNRIGVASDLSEDADLALWRAVELARLFSVGEIVLLNTFMVPAGYHTVYSWEESCHRLESLARERAEEQLARIRTRSPDGPVIRLNIAEGAAAARVPELAAADNLDLLVLTTHDRSATASFFLGRTTEKILRSASMSVWAEKTPTHAQGVLEALRQVLG